MIVAAVGRIKHSRAKLGRQALPIVLGQNVTKFQLPALHSSRMILTHFQEVIPRFDLLYSLCCWSEAI
jgi:hypothetical protein